MQNEDPAFLPPLPGETIESRNWCDEDLDNIPITRFNHDDSALPGRIAVFLAQTTTKPTSAYLTLTQWIAYQVRDPVTGKYLFPDPAPTQNAEEKASTEAAEKILGDLTPSRKVAAKIGAIDDTHKAIVPAFALFLLRLPFRRPEKIADNYFDHAFTFFRKVYSGTLGFPNIEPCEKSVKKLKNANLVCIPDMNGIMVPVLEAFKAAVDNKNKKVVSLLNFCILLHTKWHGLTAVSRLLGISKQYHLNMEYFLEGARTSATEVEINLVYEFIARYFLAKENYVRYLGNVPEDFYVPEDEEGKDFFYPWARALDPAYFATLSNREMKYLPVIWAYCTDITEEGPIWDSSALQGVSDTVKQICKNIASGIVRRIVTESTIPRKRAESTVINGGEYFSPEYIRNLFIR